MSGRRATLEAELKERRDQVCLMAELFRGTGEEAGQERLTDRQKESGKQR